MPAIRSTDLRNYRDRDRAGFTLIETLVSFSMFGVVMASLLTGLWVASEAHERIYRSTSFAEEHRKTESLFASDIAATYILTGKTPFQDLREEELLLDFFTLSVGSPALIHVQYLLDEEEEGNGKLLRRSAPVILDEPVPPYTEQTLFSGVEKAEIQYFDKYTWKADIPEAMVPQALRLCVWRTKPGRDNYSVFVAVPKIYGVTQR
ncbi:MAG: prepilin-type N-terminal cleavage/methylation domain-containing protein [Candidatus Hydrogenedentales bacterium]